MTTPRRGRLDEECIRGPQWTIERKKKSRSVIHHNGITGDPGRITNNVCRGSMKLRKSLVRITCIKKVKVGGDDANTDHVFRSSASLAKVKQVVVEGSGACRCIEQNARTTRK